MATKFIVAFRLLFPGTIATVLSVTTLGTLAMEVIETLFLAALILLWVVL